MSGVGEIECALKKQKNGTKNSIWKMENKFVMMKDLRKKAKNAFKCVPRILIGIEPLKLVGVMMTSIELHGLRRKITLIANGKMQYQEDVGEVTFC